MKRATLWNTQTLGDVCHVYQPETIPQKALIPGPYPVYGANGQIGWHSTFNHEQSELLLGCRGSVGFIHRTTGPSWINGNAMVVRPIEGRIERDFLAFALAGGTDISAAITGAAQPQITRASLSPIPISYPDDLAEQRRIVAILDEAFEGIATAKAHAERNLRNAREVFESYAKGLFLRGKDIWPAKTLEQISTNLDYRRVPITKGDRKAGEFPYYGASGIVDYVDDYIFDGDALLVSEDGANLLARSTPIAFSVSGRYWVNNHAHILQFADIATQRFVEYFLESIPLDEYITGAAQPKLNQGALNSIPIPIPQSLDEQARIVGRLNSLQERTSAAAEICARKLAALDELKQSLLHQAFSGQL